MQFRLHGNVQGHYKTQQGIGDLAWIGCIIAQPIATRTAKLYVACLGIDAGILAGLSSVYNLAGHGTQVALHLAQHGLHLVRIGLGYLLYLSHGAFTIGVACTTKLFQYIFITQEYGQLDIIQSILVKVGYTHIHVQASAVVGIGAGAAGPFGHFVQVTQHFI